MLIETERKEKKSGVRILTSHGVSRPISKEAAQRVREMYVPTEEDEDKKDKKDKDV